MIGRVIKSHGIKGELSVEATTDEPEIRFAVGEVLHGRLLITFEEVKDRTAADSLRGTQFFAPPLDNPDDEGFYDHELEGLRVIHEGADIGEVTGVTHGPVQSLLSVSLENGKEALIPFVEEIVPEVDLEEGTCTITPPEGLLEL